MINTRKSNNSETSIENSSSSPKGPVFPTECLVCDSSVIGNSVLFHCECIVAMCGRCAIQQIAAQKSTYNKGILCPYCRLPSDNIRNIELCQAEENDLISKALNFYSIRSSRHDDGVRKAISCLIADGYTMGSTSIKDLELDEIPVPQATPALRLELARLLLVHEKVLSEKITKFKNLELPLGNLLFYVFNVQFVYKYYCL